MRFETALDGVGRVIEFGTGGIGAATGGARSVTGVRAVPIAAVGWAASYNAKRRRSC